MFDDPDWISKNPVGLSLVLKNLKEFRGHWLANSFGAVSSICIYVSKSHK